MHRWQAVPGCLFLFLFLFIGCHVEGSPVASRHTLATSVISKRNDIFLADSRSAEAVTVLVTHGIDDDARQLRLNAVFSRTGNAYETQGDVAQMHMFRACEAKEKGFDHTLRDHIAVVFVDELIPGLTGCVNLENQARFAAKSGALALVVGPSNRIDKQELMKNQTTRIPVVLVDEMETPRLKAELERAAKDGQNARITLQFVEIRSAYTLRLHVFRPTLLNLALIGILVLLVIFITGLVFVKIRWRSDSHRDIWLRALARSALNKMEIRKFEKVPTSSDSLKENVRVVRVKRHDKSFLPVFGSLSSVAHTSTGQDRCSICLEEYSEGAELRVLFCGHEFHPKCVDPWLLAHRRCPLCQFDVVYKEYPQPERPPLAKTTGTQTHIALSEASQQEVPLLAGSSAATSTVFVEMAPLPSPHHRTMSNAPRTRLKPEGSPRGNMPSSSRARSTSAHRRRPLRPRHALVPTLPPPGPYPGRAQPVCVPPMVCIGTSNAHAQPIGTISGYSSDVSSYPDGPTLVDDFGVPQRIPL